MLLVKEKFLKRQLRTGEQRQPETYEKGPRLLACVATWAWSQTSAQTSRMHHMSQHSPRCQNVEGRGRLSL